MTVVDILTNSKLMMIFGIISMVLIKILITNINLNVITAPLAVFLMLNFMTSFLFIGLMGYKK